ncbi:hypothetical protein [Knoellia sinensis]|uniref:hypothetical protein n=1 Tax=Knoellia sinensis TaxID=136100 RepID=UPI0012ECA28C|nr:hypothetical protein [Knoellia sinensis]
MSRDVASALTPRAPAWVENGARLSGARANAVVTINPFEHERRMQAHLGAVTDLALLDLFLTLPQGWPVATTALDPEDWDHLRRAPRGCWTGDHGVDIVRLLQRPCQVETVVVDGDRWHKSLETARRFAAAAPVVVRTPADARVDSSMLWAAQLLGIGVWQVEGADHRVLVAPEVPPGGVVKAAKWRFEEWAYRQWLTTTGSRTPRREPETVLDPTAASSSEPGRSH